MEPISSGKRPRFLKSSIPPGDRLDVEALVVQVQVGDDILQQPVTVAVVIDGKRRLKAEVVDVAAQDAAAGGVERGNKRQVTPPSSLPTARPSPVLPCW